MANGAVRELITKVKFQIDQASLSQVNKTFQEVKKNLASISDKSLKVGATAETSKAQSALRSLKAQADNVAATTSNIKIGADTSKASNALKDVKKQVDKVSTTASKVKVNADTGKATSTLQRLKRTLNDIKANVKAKVNVDSGNANSTLARIKGQLNSLSGKVTTAYVEVKQKGKAVGEGVKKTGQALADNGGTIAATGAAMIAPMVFPIKEAMDFESAMADVRKVVDFDTPEQFKQMGRDIAELSTKIPMTKEQIASLVAAGGQANIARDQLLDFATAAGKMGVAFDISAQEAGESMAQMKSAFGMTLPQIMSLSDAINHLGNNSSASSPKVLAVIKRVGAMGELAGFSATEVAALGAAITGIGVAPEVAATGIQNMSKALTGGYAVTKDTIGAFGRIGLTFEQVKQSMQVDAKGTLLDVLTRISKLGKADQIEVLTGIFKSESLESIAPLLNNLNLLQDTLGLVGDKSKYAGSMEKEFAARNATTANSVQLLKNELHKTEGEIGEDFLPTVNRLAKGLQSLTKRFSSFSKEHPQLASGIMAGVAAFGALLVVLGGVGLAISGITTAISALAPIFAAASGVLSAGFAPVLAVIAAIAAAIYFVGTYWEQIVAWFQPGIDTMMDGLAQLQSAWQNLQPFIAAITPLLKAIATVIGVVIVGNIWVLFKVASVVFNTIARLINWIAGLLGGLGETIQWLAGGLAGLIDKAAQFIGMKGQIDGVNSSITQKWADRAMANGSTVNNSQTNYNTFTNPNQWGETNRANNTFFAYDEYR